MSIKEENFLIIGCDIKDCLTDRFFDWCLSDEGDKYECYQKKGHIQIIDDGMCGHYTYIGYILANIEDIYSEVNEEIDINNFDKHKKDVEEHIRKLANACILDKNKIDDLEIKMILFTHCS